MKTVIYYFTGTGNSLEVARELKKYIDDCQLIPMASFKEDEEVICEAQKVGLAFPLYYAGIPKIVSDFIKRLNLDKAIYIFSLVTHGNTPIRCVNKDLSILLLKKSKKLNSGFYIVMPGNYVVLYDICSNEKRDEIYKNARDKIEKIADYIKNDAKVLEKDNIITYSIGKIMHNLWVKNVNNKDKYFYCNDKCNSCGVCVKVCPVNNIVLKDLKPQWLHNCQECFACINFCPQKAIQRGKNTQKRRRYHNIAVSIKDMIYQKE